jgi:F0F1-type ATP synthase delta subunit
MEMKDIVQLVVQNKFERVLKELKKLHPEKVNEFILALQNEGKDFIDDFLRLLSDNQRKEWNWLASAKREREYLLSIPDDKMTEQDIMELKSCDF